MRRVAFLLLAVALPLAAQADPEVALSDLARTSLGLTSEAAASAYAEAYEDALAFRLDEALAGFAEVGRLAPRSAAGAYGVATVALWRAFILEEEAEFDQFYAANDSLQALADGPADAPVLAATAKLQRALAFARQERYPRAGNAFRDACGRFNSLTGPDADYGRGICQVAAGSVPRQYRWLARLFGFRGSVSGGLATLEAAASAGGLLADDAVIALAISDATLNERRGGTVDRLAALSEARPDSPVLAYLAGYHLLLDRRAVEAEAALRRALPREGAGTLSIPFVEAHLGLALYRQHRFEEALPLLEGYARTFRGRALLAQTTLRAGIAREMLGDRQRAVSHYRRVRAARDYDTDLAAAREAERRIDTPMTASDRALELGAAAYDGGRYDEAVALLQPVVTDASLSGVERAEAAYRTGRARQAQERWEEAERHFRLAVDRPGDPLAKWGPWARYHLGEVAEARGEIAEAEAYYRAVLDDEREFDYHKSLEQRTRAALERIGR